MVYFVKAFISEKASFIMSSTVYYRDLNKFRDGKIGQSHAI